MVDGIEWRLFQSYSTLLRNSRWLGMGRGCYHCKERSSIMTILLGNNYFLYNSGLFLEYDDQNEMIQQELVSPFADRILTNLLYQGSTNHCGPYSATTVINALKNLNLNPATIAQELNKPIKRYFIPIPRRIPDSATFPWGMVDIFNQFGIKSHYQFFTSYNYLMKSFQKGFILLPIIASLRPFWAHIMILIAVHPNKGLGFANTQFAYPAIDWITEKQFRQQWRLSMNCVVEVNPH